MAVADPRLIEPVGRKGLGCGHMGHQPVGADVVGAAMLPPEHLLERLGGIEIHHHAIAMGAFPGGARLLVAAAHPRPEVRRQDQRHVGIGERGELAGFVQRPHQHGGSGPGQAGNEDRIARRSGVAGEAAVQVEQHLAKGRAAQHDAVERLVGGGIVRRSARLGGIGRAGGGPARGRPPPQGQIARPDRDHQPQRNRPQQHRAGLAQRPGGEGDDQHHRQDDRQDRGQKQQRGLHQPPGIGGQDAFLPVVRHPGRAHHAQRPPRRCVHGRNGCDQRQPERKLAGDHGRDDDRRIQHHLPVSGAFDRAARRPFRSRLIG